MAVAGIQKVHIIAHSGIMQSLLSSLQKEGLVQIEKADLENLGLSTPFTEITHLEHVLHRLSRALQYLSQWEEKGLAKKMFAPKPQISIPQSEEVLNQDYSSILDEVEKLEKEKNDLHSHIKFLEKEEDFLHPLESLSLPLKSVSNTETTEVILGVMPLSSFRDLESEAEDKALWIHVISQGKRSVYVLLVYLASQKEDLQQLLKQMNLYPLYFMETMLHKAGDSGTVADVLAKIGEEKVQCGKKLESLEGKGKELALSREQLMGVHDVLLNEREKWLSSRNLGETDQVFFLEGWIKTSEIPSLEAKLEPYSELIQCYFRPPIQEEDPPVILENPRIGKPFELITKLYGLPQRNTMDPTLPLAPFFFLFALTQFLLVSRSTFLHFGLLFL